MQFVKTNNKENNHFEGFVSRLTFIETNIVMDNFVWLPIKSMVIK